MIFKETKLKGAYTIDLEPFTDERGLFARTFCRRAFADIGHQDEFVQFNHSRTHLKGAIRGMHYQLPPSAEIKLIRCVRGRVYDVIVDLRKDSPTLLQYVGLELSDRNMQMIYVPVGFAHGFQTLEDDTELIYHHTAYYAPELEAGLRFDDPTIGINWPLLPTVLSAKDQQYAVIGADFTGIPIS